MVNQLSDTQPKMDTSQQINHVFLCSGTPAHVSPGLSLLRAGDITKCPQCGAPVQDCTNTLIGKSFLAFAGFTREDAL